VPYPFRGLERVGIPALYAAQIETLSRPRESAFQSLPNENRREARDTLAQTEIPRFFHQQIYSTIKFAVFQGVLCPAESVA
jgi:hypothetical protein